MTTSRCSNRRRRPGDSISSAIRSPTTACGNLPELDFLDLRRNKITDAGLVHLEKLSKLKNLYLIGTQVTPAGVSKLQKKLPDAKIAL